MKARGDQRTAAVRPMRDSGVAWIGSIPEGWKVVRNKYLFSYHKDIAGDKADSFERLALTMKGVIKRSKEANEGLQPEEFSGYQVLRPNELVFKLIDLKNISTSRVGLSPYEGIVSPAYIIVSCGEAVSPSFAEKYFLSMWMNAIFNQLGDSGVRSALSSSDLLGLPFVLPPLPEQRAIAAFLDRECGRIDGLRAKIEQQIEKLGEYKKSLITEAVTGKKKVEREAKAKGEGEQWKVSSYSKLRDSGVAWIGSVPEGWKVKRLRFLGSCTNGLSKGGEYFGTGFPFVSYGDVYKNFSLPPNVIGLVESNEDERSLYSVKRGDVFFTRTSETIEELGMAAVCLSDIAEATFAGFLIRFRPTSNELVPEYSKYYFRNVRMRDYFKGTSGIVTRASLSQQLLKDLEVLLPPLPEQRAIAAYLDEKCGAIDAVVGKCRVELDKLAEYKKSLIFECVTGKREVA